MKSRGQRFRELHEQPGIFVAGNPWNAGTAKILARLGFPALATSSAGLAFSMGLPDGDGAVNAEVTLAHCREIVKATELPVTADLENGFGDSPEIVAETIRRACEIGLAGASIEDATYNKEAPLYDRSLAVERIAAAVETARAQPNPFVLTARTEGFIRNRPDFDETLTRLLEFQRAGADVLYAPGLPDPDSLQRVCAAVSRPVNFVAGISPFRLPLEKLRELGVKRVSAGTSFVRRELSAFIDAASEVIQHGTFDYSDGLMGVAKLNEFFRD
jgi:2-methylisocitrate lyase-like PEP mutase family enzyme